jgi:hypothetical protein
MPRSEPRLPDHEIDLLRRWIEQGSPWTVEPGAARDVEPVGGLGIADLLRAVLEERAPVLLGVLLLALLSVRARRTRASQASPEAGRWRGTIGRCLSLFGVSEAVAVILLLSIASLFEENALLTRRVAQVKGNAALEHRHVFGSPPEPFRPDKEPELESVYFRGNCERRPDLFNGGNYRTATLHLRLLGKDEQPLRVGDRVEEAGLVAEIEIVRAPNTQQGMYSDRLMGGVFLTETHYPDRVTRLVGKTVVLETLDPGNRWRARYPLDGRRSRDKDRLQGLIYLHVNLRNDGKPFFPVVHYGIRYDLHLRDGILREDSDLWLGNLYWTPRLEVPRPHAVPMREWFDVEEIPLIPDPEIPGAAPSLPRVEPPPSPPEPPLPGPSGA